MQSFDFQPITRVVFGPRSIDRLGQLARESNFHRTLLVSDSGLRKAGHVDAVISILESEGIEVSVFDELDVNPDSRMVEAGRAFAADLEIDSIVALGGGSSLDAAKGINFVLTNGGAIEDYRGYGKATLPLLPAIAIPTTAGTGSEAQSYAVIADAVTHQKLACGDRKATFRVAILDPVLTLSQPRSITATSGFDAIAHAVETFVTTRRNALSEFFSREAWRLLNANYERVMTAGDDLEARGAMQLGAYFAGLAIENSMLGATHACANPLTAHYNTVHGAALALLLPTVVRWNADVSAERYAELVNASEGQGDSGAEILANRLEQLAEVGELNGTLETAGIAQHDLPMLAEEAATQWTGTFNPRPFDAAGALEIYATAF